MRPMVSDPPSLVLASGSRHRASLLRRLSLPFLQDPPGIDETPRHGEDPAETAVRLARAKAETVAARHPRAIVIGSDQVAVRDGEPLGKPGHAPIARYLEKDRPFDCAGSFRSESLGVALVERIDSQDPTALVGLPLIWLSGALARLGLPVL